MSDTETIRGFLVSPAPSAGVLVKVYESKSGEEAEHRHQIAERAAQTWVELARLGAEFEVPRDLWTIDADARAILDADS